MIFNILINKKAFSLLEMTIVVIIMTVLATFAVPSMYRVFLEKAGTKTALEIQNIQDAARSYYLKNGYWPSSINASPGDLESANFLPSGWVPQNPFINPGSGTYFTYSAAPNALGTLFVVSTNVADGAQNIVASKLPMSSISGSMVTSTIGLPGGPVTPAIKVFTGTVSNGGTIPLPPGYTDSQCQWFVSPYNALFYDSSGKGGCENLETAATYLYGPNGRTAMAYTSGDCRGSWGFTLNYIGICLNS